VFPPGAGRVDKPSQDRQSATISSTFRCQWWSANLQLHSVPGCAIFTFSHRFPAKKNKQFVLLHAITNSTVNTAVAPRRISLVCRVAAARARLCCDWSPVPRENLRSRSSIRSDTQTNESIEPPRTRRNHFFSRIGRRTSP
ncbi:unnamed protein product, partial [Ectocarpus sp. 12 AP-2014]